MNLTQKQEKFCLSYMETGNASEAYRQSYDAGKMKPETVNREAKKLLDTPKIATRIGELRKAAEKRNAITVDDLVSELEEARKAALGAVTPQAGAAVSATMGKGKLLGLVVDKAEAKIEHTAPLSRADFYKADA